MAVKSRANGSRFKKLQRGLHVFVYKGTGVPFIVMRSTSLSAISKSVPIAVKDRNEDAARVKPLDPV